MHRTIDFPNLGIHLKSVGDHITVFGFDIAYYGIVIGIGILAGLMMAVMEAKRTHQNIEDYYDLAIYGVIFSIIGARAYYVIFSWDMYKDDIKSIINIREGGLAIYGGVLTGILCGIIFAKKRGINFFLLADTVLPSVLLGQVMGRWGNFFNREAFGGYTNGLFAMRILKEQASYLPQSALNNLITVNGTEYIQVHPTFLYESSLNLCLLVFLLILRKHKKFNGQIASLYMFGYGIIRFFVESLRTDQLQIGSTGIAVSQAVSAVLIIIGIIFYIKLKKESLNSMKGDSKIDS